MLEVVTKHILKNHPIEMKWDYSDMSGIIFYYLNRKNNILSNLKKSKKKQSLIIHQNKEEIEFKIYCFNGFTFKKLSEFSIKPKLVTLNKPRIELTDFEVPITNFKIKNKNYSPLFFKLNSKKNLIEKRKLNVLNVELKSIKYYE